MGSRRVVSGVLAGGVAAIGLVGVAATPAFAADHGPELDGDFFWFSDSGPLVEQSSVTQVSSGSDALSGGVDGGGRPYVTATVGGLCPVDADYVAFVLRIPESGTPENTWAEVRFGAAAVLKDADGHFYTSAAQQADSLAKPQIMAYLGANGGTGDFPYVASCTDAATGQSLGHFRTMLHVEGTGPSGLSWSIPREALPAGPTTATTTALTVTPESGGAYAAVTLTATVTSGAGTPTGVVHFRAGTELLASVPVVNGVASLVTNTLGPSHVDPDCEYPASYPFSSPITAAFEGNGPYLGSVSVPVEPSYDVPGGCGDLQTVTVEIPAGTITITTPYTPAAPLALGVATLDPSDSTYSASAAFSDIVITDRRAGDLGFTASVASGPFLAASDSFPGIHAGLTGLIATQVPGNALQATNVVLTDRAPFYDGLGVPKAFAQYAAGQSIGAAHIDGVFGVDQVPTSVTPGLYTATVTFTAV